jgi:predicted kinase
MPTVHLVCGPTGAGKTMYAIALAKRCKGVRFSIDEWMAGLFGPDWPPTASLDWMLQRTRRCEAQMWSIADQLIAMGTDVIFDVSLSKSEDRDRFRTRAAQTVAESKLHYLDVDRETRRARVMQRNLERAGTHSFHVSDAMFDFMESWFEPPTDDELYGAMIVCDG